MNHLSDQTPRAAAPVLTPRVSQHLLACVMAFALLPSSARAQAPASTFDELRLVVRDGNSPSNDSLAVFSTSGNIMYFHSDRPGGCGTGDLWTSRAKRGGDVWAAPVNMGCVVNTTSTEIAPAFYANDDQGLSTIYFGSNRPGGIGGFDVYETWTTDEDLESAVWGPGMLVPELSSPKRDTRTFVRRDGREVFITTDRDFGVGGLDIWVAAREDSSNFWSTPVNPGPPLNSAADDGSPALSRDGRTLYFFSTRPGGFGGRDIWFTVRTKP
jgi:hypothetical protein